MDAIREDLRLATNLRHRTTVDDHGGADEQHRKDRGDDQDFLTA